MSLKFNHPHNTITSDDEVVINTTGGTPTIPRNIRLNASSLIVPNVELPRGEPGALVYDVKDRLMKFYNGIEWVSWASEPKIIEEIELSLKEIYDRLDKKVETVTYSTSTIPTASISGTNLNIVFPITGADKPDTSGLYTSLPTGSISYYSLSSGQNFASIREQMGGKTGSQNGRDGTQAKPYISETGWCLADGKYWTWTGSTGTRTVQTPNLNRNQYLKSITETTGTNTNDLVLTSGAISTATITFPKHYHGTGSMASYSDKYSADDSLFIFGRTFPGSYRGVLNAGDTNQGRKEVNLTGSDNRIALTTTDPVYTENNVETNTHTHDISGLEVQHLKVAVLYNIAIPEKALNKGDADGIYVKKAGDVMTGSLNVKNQFTIYGDSTLLQIPFKNASNAEIGNVFVDSRDSSVNIRAGVSDVLKISTGDKITFNGNNLVRKINGVSPNSDGNVEVSGIPVGGILLWATSTPPAGFIEMNGKFDVNRYPKLAALFPDGNIPDMRGMFARGWDNGRNTDPSRPIRSTQDDTMQKITGHFTVDDQSVETNGTAGRPTGAFYASNKGYVGYDASSRTDKWWAYKMNFDSSRVVRTSDETRPKNVSLMYIMRAE